MKIKRKIEIAVISDVYLGTPNCHAKHLLNYLNSIEPKKLILNGNFIDVWQFSKRCLPKIHLKIIKKILTMAANGVEIVYITGNQDAKLRKFNNSKIVNISIVDKLVLNLHGKKAWLFHGDIFDVTTKSSKWLAKMGSYGYKILNTLNHLCNWYLKLVGKERLSLSKKNKNSAKGTLKDIENFEKLVTNLAIENHYNYVICGHTHHPKIEYIETKHGETTYLNSGDWIEHSTALEYQFKRWKLYHYCKDKLLPFSVDDDMENTDFKDLIAAITILQQREKNRK